MRDSTFITRVILENYKSIARCDVRLGSLTFLVGPNGAGKSNFLDALRFVRDGLAESLEHALHARGGGGQLIHHPAGGGASFGLHLEFTLPSGRQGSYAVRIGRTPVNGGLRRWEVLKEECRLRPVETGAVEAFFRAEKGKIVSSVDTMPAGTLDRLYLARASADPSFREVYDALCDMQFYRIEPQAIPDIETYELPNRLRPDGANLASTLMAMTHADPQAGARIQEFLRVILPTLVKVSVEPVFVQSPSGKAMLPPDEGNGRIALVFQQKIGRSVDLFGPTQMSEGTLRALAILVSLYQVEPYHGRSPALTAVEDVEAAIHPAELAVLFAALDEASLRTQILVTSQSPELLEQEQLPPGSILAVSAADGITRIGPPDEACRSALAGNQFTAGELLRMGQLVPDDSGAAPPRPAATEVPG